MTRINHIKPEFVEFIPERLASGVLYISKRYATASHLCCCGCGLEVVTPLNAAKWQLTRQGGVVSLRPSVGNWSFPCQSHYWITGNQVRWAAGMSPERIAAVKARDKRDVEAAVKARDKRDVEAMAPQELGLFARLAEAVVNWVKGLFGR